MLLNLPDSLQYFFQLIFVQFNIMSQEQRNYTKATVCAILFHQEKVSMRIIGSILPGFQRTKSAVSKMYSNSKFFSQEVAWQSTMLICKMANKRMPYSKKPYPWVLIFDTTHRTRFGKLLENLIGSHGENSKKRYFPCVWGLLIAPTGERISLPCLAWYSKKYAKENNLRYLTQPKLAVLTAKWLGERLKQSKIQFDLVIVADSAFECNALWTLCQRYSEDNQSHWTIITCCSADRCLGANGPKASRIWGEKVHQQFTPEDVSRARKLNCLSFTGIDVRSQRKLQNKQSSHFYRYAKKQLRVSEIGDSNAVISYKLENKLQPLHLASVKVFLCNDLELSPEKIISYYTLRWEVETFFREQKSDLAFCDFQAYNPDSCYKFIDHLVLSFNFLEFYRIGLIDSPDYTLIDSQFSLRYMRTRLLKETFRRQAFADQLRWILDRTKTPYGIRRLCNVFEHLKMPLTSFDIFQNLQN